MNVPVPPQISPAWVVLWLIIGTGTLRLGAAPGGLDSVAPPLELRGPGRVVAAAGLADGRVVAGGDFWWLNGEVVPGLARMESNGQRDSSFVPAVGLMMLQGMVSLPNASGGLDWPSVTLLPLPDGRLWMDVRRRDHLWTVLGPQGALALGNLAALTTGPQTQVHAEGLGNGHLVVGLISRPTSQTPTPSVATAELRAVSLENGQTIWSHTKASGPQPLRAWPVGDGRWWVAGNVNVVDPAWPAIVPGTAKEVWRINGDGTSDETLPPLSLPRGFIHQFQPLPDARLAVLATDQRTLAYWPRSFSLPVTGRVFLPDGTIASSFTAGSQSLSVGLRVSGTPDGALLTNVNTDPSQLRRMGSDGGLDPFLGPVPFPADSALLSLGDGRIMIGASRYLANGLPDSGWQVPDLQRPAKVWKLAPAPGDGVYAAGDFVKTKGEARARVIRLDAQGVPDPGFQLDPQVVGRVMDIQSLPDGRLMVLEDRGSAPAGVSSSRLVRLLASGMLDPDYPPFEGVVPSTTGAAGLTWVGRVERMTTFHDGSVVVLTYRPESEIGGASWHSLLPNGQPDPGFRLISDSQNLALLALSDGKFWKGGQRHLRNGTTDLKLAETISNNAAPCLLSDGRVVFKRSGGGLLAVLPSGALDETFSLPLPSGSWVEQMRSDGRGGLFARYYAPGSNLRDIPFILRLRGDGRPDPAFRCAPVSKLLIPPNTAAQSMGSFGQANAEGEAFASLSDIMAVPGGVWVAGDFTKVGGQPRYGLVRLSTDRAPGYPGWAEAVFSAFPPEPAEQEGPADPDRDGVPNALEYATGTDPLFPDASDSQLLLVSRQPLIFSLPRNPDAAMFPSVEAAGRLEDWQPAALEDIGMTVQIHTIRIEVKSPAAGRFFRIRFRPMP